MNPPKRLPIGKKGPVPCFQPLLITIVGWLALLPPSLSANDSWANQAPMPTARLGLAACSVHGKIYAIGGYPAANIAGLSTVEEYDPVTNTWTTKTPMPTGRRWLAASAVEGKIYAFGGFETKGSPPLPTVEAYDIATDSWSAKADMPTARKGLSTAVVNGKIYAIGGANVNEQRIGTVEMYDPATDLWSSRAPMPTARSLFATSVVDGKIYAAGGPWPGSAGVATLEEYDPVADTWTTKTSMPTARWGLTACTVDGKLHAIGGATGTSAFSVVETYDPRTDLWTEGIPMTYLGQDRRGNPASQPFRSWGLTSVTLENRLFVMGGASSGPPHPGTDTVIQYTLAEASIPLELSYKRTSNGTLLLSWENPEPNAQIILEQSHEAFSGAWSAVTLTEERRHEIQLGQAAHLFFRLREL